MPLFGKKQETAPATEPPLATLDTAGGNPFLDEAESIRFNLDTDRSSHVHEPSPPSERAYGVGDLIRLLNTLPIDHHPDLVLRVIKTTLESVGVQSATVIEDALFQENLIRDRMAMLDREILEFAQQIQTRQGQIAELNAELSATLDARQRLENTTDQVKLAPQIDLSLSHRAAMVDIDEMEIETVETKARAEVPPPRAAPKPGSLPPPMPPPRRKLVANETAAVVTNDES